MLLTLAAIVVFAMFGLRKGVDFAGGSALDISFKSNRPSTIDIRTTIETVSGIADLSVNHAGDTNVILRMKKIENTTANAVVKALSDKFGTVVQERFESISPAVGKELFAKSLRGIILLLITIMIYLAYVFRKMSVVTSPWIMGLASVVALLHDIVIPVGIFSLLGRYQGVEVSAIFVAAILTILGYSISDTVVVFDRVRENTLRMGSKQPFGQIVHTSIMQTLTRSLNTTFTTLLSLLAIFFFGGETIHFFALALIIGITLGAYSSIFVASPILVWAAGRRK